jgi:4-alpha-glucanotransferase
MDSRQAFRSIADLLGIQTRHVDALGVVHEPSAETLAALVAAFNLPPDPIAAAVALQAAREATPLRLDPLHVIAAEVPRPTVPLHLPPDAGVVEWRCDYEDGTSATGRSEVTAAADRPGEAELPLPVPLPLGYHQLILTIGRNNIGVGLAVAPPACYLPPCLEERARAWGLTTQLYGLHSAHNWGVGDFADLAALCRGAGSFGAATVGINPLHALFGSEPQHVSPYSPSSRMQLDYLYIDVTAVPGFAEDPAIVALAPKAAIKVARASELIDYAAVAALKRPVLEALHHRFCTVDLLADGGARSARGAAFRAFQAEGGNQLAAFALFEALHEQLYRERGVFSWHDWPAALRDPNSAEVAAFADAHRERVEFFQFLQWEADRQLAAAATAGRASGLSLGLYRDLAVGVNPHGAEAWADQELVAPGVGIGAPPDPLSRAGQDWGLAPVNPLTLKLRGFRPFTAALRANMRHAGILRIDHVMSLQRLYWVPTGNSAMDGAYVDYPFTQLLRLVALESQRAGCAVIGEDLGTVPEGFRDTLRAANLLSYRVVAFERRGDGNFVPPSDYPELATASAATHDLPTLKGFWLGRDIAWRQSLGLYPDAAAEAADLADRHSSRWQLLEALEREGLMARARLGEFLPEGAEPVFTAELGEAILRFLARSRSRLMLIQLDDIVGEGEQANLPGTTDAHPNWRRRLAAQLEDILAGPEMKRIAALVSEEGRGAA